MAHHRRSASLCGRRTLGQGIQRPEPPVHLGQGHLHPPRRRPDYRGLLDRPVPARAAALPQAPAHVMTTSTSSRTAKGVEGALGDQLVIARPRMKHERIGGVRGRNWSRSRCGAGPAAAAPHVRMAVGSRSCSVLTAPVRPTTTKAGFVAFVVVTSQSHPAVRRIVRIHIDVIRGNRIVVRRRAPPARAVSARGRHVGNPDFRILDSLIDDHRSWRERSRHDRRRVKGSVSLSWRVQAHRPGAQPRERRRLAAPVSNRGRLIGSDPRTGCPSLPGERAHVPIWIAHGPGRFLWEVAA